MRYDFGGPIFGGAYTWRGLFSEFYGSKSSIHLFRERLSNRMHEITPKGIVGGFEFTVFQRNLIEWQERPWTVCL